MQQALAPPQTGRDQAIDATRGIAILAVVLFHVTRGFVSAGSLPASPALSFADTFAYAFHVPTFLLIAGYLAFPKASQPGFQLRRQAWFFHTYLLWSLASWGLVALFSDEVNTPFSLRDLLLIPIVPIQHYWFLPALMLGTALLAVLRTPFALIAGALVTLILAPLLQYLPSPLGAMTSVCMLLIGGLLRATGIRPPASLPLALICIGVVALSIWWRMSTEGVPELYPLLRVPITLCGCYAAYAVASLAAQGGIGTVLAYFGRHSLTIFLLHIIAGSGARVILAKIMPDMTLYAAIPLVIFMSLAAPLIFEKIAQRLGIDGWLGLRPLFFNDKATEAPAEPLPALIAPEPGTARAASRTDG